MNPFTVPTRFTAVDQMSAPVRGMARNVHDAFSKMDTGIARQERLFRKLTPGIGDATKQLLGYASAGTVLAGLGFSGKAIMDYETAIQSLSAVTGVSGQDLEVYKKEIADVANVTHKSATDIAGSYEVIGSMMSQYLQDPKALRQISMAGITLAKASRQELVPTLEQLTSIMNQFDLKANQVSDTINRLTAGEIVGSLRTSQVTEALQEFGAGAYAANIDLSESVALVEALAKQMKTDKIGVGARNILTVMDSATGLAKKARKELRHAGVDMQVLMDKNLTLSQRLHELSKVAGNEKAITKIFGRENKTAAQVIFNQLDVYDKFVNQIRTTNQAEVQAATNSKTLRQEIDRLKNTWINYLVSGDAANAGLEKAKNIIHFVAENMDTIVSTGINVLKFYALWKGAILAQNAVMLAYNATMVVSRTISGAYFLTDMVKYVATTQGITKATAAWKIVQAELNTILLANPIGIAVAGLAALAAGIYMASERNKELTEQYRKRVNLQIADEVKKEAAEVQKLVEKYVMLGHTVREANTMAIKERILDKDVKRKQVETEIKGLKKELADEKNKIYFADLLYGGGTPEVGKRAEIAEKLSAAQTKAKLLATDQNYELQYAAAAVDQGIVSKSDVASVFTARSKKGPEQAGAPGEAVAPDYLGSKDKVQYGPMLFDYNKMAELIRGSQKVIVEFKGAPPGTTVSGGGSGVSTSNSY